MLRAGRAAEPEALEIGVSGPEQRAEIEEIWRASFPEDSAAARALFLDRLLPCGYCLSGSVGGRPVTMAFLLPAVLIRSILLYCIFPSLLLILHVIVAFKSCTF